MMEIPHTFVFGLIMYSMVCKNNQICPILQSCCEYRYQSDQKYWSLDNSEKGSLTTIVALMTCFLASVDHEEFNVKGYIEAVFIISPCDFQFKLRVLCNTQYGGTVSWKLFQTSYCGEFYNRGKVYCRFRSDKQDVESYSSFMNLVWFQDGFCQWDTSAGSCSITQSEESRFDL